MWKLLVCNEQERFTIRIKLLAFFAQLPSGIRIAYVHNEEVNDQQHDENRNQPFNHQKDGMVSRHRFCDSSNFFEVLTLLSERYNAPYRMTKVVNRIINCRSVE